MQHSIEQESSSIQINSSDLQNVKNALEDIKAEQMKFESLHDELTMLANQFRCGHVGEITDSFLVDEVIAILKKY